MGNYSLVVLDFETSGLSVRNGDRAIEIGAVLIENNIIVDRFQSLMNPGFKINSFIESYTGITNEMVAKAPPREEVMAKFSEFIGELPLVAHNASFDRGFLDCELSTIGKSKAIEMACSMSLARRIYPQAPNHKLGTLVYYCGIQSDGTFHRALADAEMTGHLWVAMINEVKELSGMQQVSFELMQKLSKMSSSKVSGYLKKMDDTARLDL